MVDGVTVVVDRSGVSGTASHGYEGNSVVVVVGAGDVVVVVTGTGEHGSVVAGAADSADVDVGSGVLGVIEG